jgi:lipoprotein-anchoring transpeptidase ErfK/SrfK
VVLTAAVAVAFPILSGRTTPPIALAQAAQQALSDARSADAGRWATDELRAAEAAFRAAQAEQRKQEVRLLPTRDFRAAAAMWEGATQAAEHARTLAMTYVGRARNDAREALSSAAEALRGAQAFGEAMHLAAAERRALQRASLAQQEAQHLYDAGDFVAAATRARAADEMARHVGAGAANLASRYTDSELLARWQRMARDTIDWSKRAGRPAIVVYKEKHRLMLYDDGRLVRVYACDLGSSAVNDKMLSGDNATPEGKYKVLRKRTDSIYKLALLLDYPNADDRAQFERLKRERRIPKSARIGGLIEIHGDGGRGDDWTQGCVALSNQDMRDLFDRVAVQTPVTIVGGDGSGGVFSELVRRHKAATKSQQR